MDEKIIFIEIPIEEQGLKLSIYKGKKVFFVDEKKYNGILKYITEKNELIKFGMIKNGFRHGTWKGYDKKGNLLIETTYNNGYVKGLIEYEQTNNMKVKQYISNENEINSGKYYFYEKGKLIEESNITDNKRHGQSLFYNLNGDLILKRNYENGSKKGKELEYYSNGNVKTERNYLNNEKDGKELIFNNQGTLVETKTYRRSVLDGIYRKYNDDGNLLYETFYKNGKKIKYENYYYENGNIKSYWEIKDNGEKDLKAIWDKYGMRVSNGKSKFY